MTDALPPDSKGHLVIKRGHRGRYRFVLLNNGERIGGEVYLGYGAASRDDLHALALSRIARLARELLQDVTICGPTQTPAPSSFVASFCFSEPGHDTELEKGGGHG